MCWFRDVVSKSALWFFQRGFSFATSFSVSHYIWFIFILMVISGLLCVSCEYVIMNLVLHGHVYSPLPSSPSFCPPYTDALASPPPCRLPCASAIKWSSPTSFSHYWWDKFRLVLWRQVLARQGLPEYFWQKERPHLVSSYLTEGQAGQTSSAVEGRRWQRSAVGDIGGNEVQVVIRSEMQGVEGHHAVINANRLPSTQILIK